MGLIIAKHNKRITITISGLRHVMSRHPEINRMLDGIVETLEKPDYIHRSKRDPSVLLYYKFYERRRKYLCVVVRIFNGEGLFLTSYITDKIKPGEQIDGQK